MKRLICVGIAVCFMFLALHAASAAGENKAYYLLGASDVIEVSVWGHPELTKTMRIRPDGWISYPLAGEFQASGVAPAKLAGQIHDKLLAYFKDPKVSIVVSEYKSKQILVLGAIKKPGLYQYEGGMSAFDAVGLAEGYGKHAELKSIVVIRNGYSAKPEFYLVNLYKAIHDGSTEGDVFLQPKDIVYVPLNAIGNIGEFADFWVSHLKPAADTYSFAAIAANQ